MNKKENRERQRQEEDLLEEVQSDGGQERYIKTRKIRKIDVEEHVDIFYPDINYQTASLKFVSGETNISNNDQYALFCVRQTFQIQFENSFFLYEKLKLQEAKQVYLELKQRLDAQKPEKRVRQPKTEQIKTKKQFKIDTETRQSIIKLIQQGQDNQFIAAKLFLSAQDIARVRNEFKIINKITTDQQGVQQKVTFGMRIELESFIYNNIGLFVSYKTMSKHMNSVFPQLKFGNSTIQRMLEKLNLTYKKCKINPIERNSERILHDRKFKGKIMASFIQNQKTIIYIDESAIDETLVPRGGYSVAGTEFVVTQKPKKRRFSLLAAITKDKLIGYMVFEGSVKAADYGSFVLEIIAQNQEIKNNLKNCIFYMDNARIHHAKILKPIFCKLNIFYSPAYSPFLNPIEEYFAILKSRMRHLIFNSRYQLIKNLHKTIFSMEKYLYQAFYRHTIKCWIKSLNREIIN